MEDLSRCFPVPPLPAAAPPDLPRRFDAAIDQLSSVCWSHYEDSNPHRHRHSLYLGSLGPCAYVRYRLAQSLSWDDAKDQKRQLLHDAARATEIALESEAKGRRMRVTLLEGERVGALALAAAIHHALQSMDESARSKASQSKKELLDIGNKYVANLPKEGECEVLYGSAGYLSAIAFVRCETDDHEFGKELVQKIVKGIVKNGETVAKAYGAGLPLMWEWHGTAYLGAIHGVAGILFTLLCFYEEVSLIEGAVEEIKSMIAKLDEMCMESGNLRSSLGKERDKLVHCCHGCPGHILLLVKAYEVLNEEQYLIRAEQIATSVLCRRGLLRKGVGLCHGISGNAYCFLALYRGRNLVERRNEGDGSRSNKAHEWLRWATHFATLRWTISTTCFGFQTIRTLCTKELRG